MKDTMTLLRLIARPMLASIFVIQGAKALRDPDQTAPAAKPLTDQVMPRVKQVAPAQVSARIPEDARTLVRVNGAVHVAGGLALATGKFRRAGALALAASLVPTTAAGHAFWGETDPGARAGQQVHFLKNVSMAGGLLLAALDTEGKPGLVWRARHGSRKAKRASRRATKNARREAKLAASKSKLR